jgi:hypothetical protein
MDCRLVEPERRGRKNAERFPQEIRITARPDSLEYRTRGPPHRFAGSELLYPQRLIRTTDP